MKKFITLLISLSLLLLACGCRNAFTAPKEVTLKYLEPTGMTEQTASVVTILSSGRVYTAGDSYTTTRVLSGVLLGNDGYILTSSEACNFDISDNGTIYKGEFSQAYAVLSDVYQDQKHYSLKLIDQSAEAGLSLFKFETKFYHEDQNGKKVEGFQYCVCFSSRDLQTGMQCYAVGNSLAELLANNTFFHTSFSDLRLCVTKGVVSMESVPSDILDPYTIESRQAEPYIISAATNREMCGGAVYDENGYLIGIVASKLVSDTEEETVFLTKMSLALESSWIEEYINFVSQRDQIEIPYTIAKNQEADTQ